MSKETELTLPVRGAESEVWPCRKEPDLFLPDTQEELERAQSLCAVCPVREACLELGLSKMVPSGVLGGVLFVKGRRVDSPLTRWPKY